MHISAMNGGSSHLSLDTGGPPGRSDALPGLGCHVETSGACEGVAGEGVQKSEWRGSLKAGGPTRSINDKSSV